MRNLIVFSHNDTQENNFLYRGEIINNQELTEKDAPGAMETYEKIDLGEMIILDFEYSDLNYCGMDLASYINESTIKYFGTYPYY